jgi:hypothetical protein
MPPRSQRTEYPDKKISETFLQFAEPLLEPLGPDATEPDMEEALKIAFTVWNAVVYETVNGETRHVEMVRELTAQHQEIAAVVSHMIDRKHRHFGDDYRLVGEFKLTRKGDELRLWAEARDPRPSN